MGGDSKIYVNRNLHLERVQFIGFDLDYTLAEYISPNYHELTLRHAVNELISMGYPPELKKVKYNPNFATRGIIFDKKYGNFLKVDSYGNILIALHGLFYLDLNETRQRYRNRFINLQDNERFIIFNTLFEFPVMFLMSYVIDYFEKLPEWKINDSHSGIENCFIKIYYKTISNDVLSAFDCAFRNGFLKKDTVDNISHFIKKDKLLIQLLQRIRGTGRKTFLVTNSEYWYADALMNYLIDINLESDYSKDWKNYFDAIFVDAMKPKFFDEGSSICQIDLVSGKKHIGVYNGKIHPGEVFSGGNSEILCEILGAQGKDILYVGDHIYGDILKCKKKQAWKTFLVVPELLNEISMWNSQKDNYMKIGKYESKLSSIYKNVDLNTKLQPTIVDQYVAKIRNKTIQIEQSYGVLGSLLRCGYRQTFFAGQLLRYADLYSDSCINLIYYPFFYLFTAPISLMPHESPFESVSKMENNSKVIRNSKKREITDSLSVNDLSVCINDLVFEQPD